MKDKEMEKVKDLINLKKKTRLDLENLLSINELQELLLSHRDNNF